MSTLGDRLSAARKATDDGETPLDPAEPGAESTAAEDADGVTDEDQPSTVPSYSAKHAGTPKVSTPDGRPDPRPDPRRALVTTQQDRMDELKLTVHSELLKQLGPKLYGGEMDVDELDRQVRVVLGDVLSRQDRPLSNSDRVQVTQEISDDILGYGPIEPFLRDSDVSEVMVNGPDSVWVERSGRLSPVHAHFSDEAHLRRTIDKIVSRIGRRVDESSPMVDARLPDGSRVNAVIPPLAVDGSALTIRKFSSDPLTVHDLIRFGSLSDATADFLDACVRGRLNIIVSGGTGAGKTTTLNVLSSFIPDDERIVTIEDAAELQLKQEHVVTAGVPPVQHRGQGRGHDPRPGQEQPAHAARPDHRR